MRPLSAPKPWQAALLAACGCGLLAACSHDWDVYLPPVGGTTTGSGGSGATGGGNPGGWGGTPVILGTCPDSDPAAPTLIKLPNVENRSLCIGESEVTRAQYEVWLTAMGPAPHPAPDGMPTACASITDYTPSASWPPGGLGLDGPVTFVNWCDGYAFCLAHGQRLCGHVGLTGGNVDFTESNLPGASEWFSACTNAGNTGFAYGNTYVANRCNGLDYGANKALGVMTLVECRGMAPVFDLSGNVWEWEDSCESDATDAGNPLDDQCRQRGGAYNGPQEDLRCGSSSQTGRGLSYATLGFRCCANPIP
jgi:formylglycine-generating enzyme